MSRAPGLRVISLSKSGTAKDDPRREKRVKATVAPARRETMVRMNEGEDEKTFLAFHTRSMDAELR